MRDGGGGQAVGHQGKTPVGASVGWPPWTALLMWQQLVEWDVARDQQRKWAGSHQTAGGCEFKSILSDRRIHWRCRQGRGRGRGSMI